MNSFAQLSHRRQLLLDRGMELNKHMADAERRKPLNVVDPLLERTDEQGPGRLGGIGQPPCAAKRDG